jgi:peptidoglycan/LPS O-acetylase OafA/YrhL
MVAAASVEAGALWRALSGRTLTYIGRRSYALYLWHYVWLTWLRSLGLIGVAGALVASFACAEASWQLVERRALAHKRRLDPPTRPTTRTTVSVSSGARVATPSSSHN